MIFERLILGFVLPPTIGFSCLVSAVVLSAERLVQFEAPIQNLCGVIEKKNVFGPPNYGESPETDKKLPITVLRLYEPLKVVGSADPQLQDKRVQRIDRVQLHMPVVEQDKLTEGVTACLSGILSQRLTSGVFEAALLSVGEVQ